MDISNAIVVGGGIGGLAVACALAKRGVAVTIIEQAQGITEVGAGLQVSPNGLAVLRSLGLETMLRQRGAVQGRAVVLRRDKDSSEVARLDLTRLPDGQRYYFVHRADLVSVLAAAAKRENVSFEFGKQVASVRHGALPQIQLTDGSTRRAELIIAADGIHSVARPVINGQDQAVFTGQVAWRALIANQFDHPPEARVTMGAGRHLVSYPLRNNTLINLVAVEERDSWAAEGWNHSDDPAHLKAAFAQFGGSAGDMIDAVRHVTLWGLHNHPVADRWQAGGIALLGDAAHPTLPFLAQGANMALEDAWVLSACLHRMPRDAALAAYQHRREARVRRVIKAAAGNARRYHLKPGAVRWGAHLGLTMASRLAPGKMLGAFDWLYAHDVTAAQPKGG